MTDPSNYGFLTQDGVFIESNQQHKSNTLHRHPKVNLVNEKQVKGSNIYSAVDLSSNRNNLKNNKNSWWKSLFGKKKHIKTDSKQQLHPCNSDENLHLRSKNNINAESNRVKRGRKCMSVIENQSVDIFDEKDLTLETKTLYKLANNNSDTLKKCNAVFHDNPATKSIKTDMNQNSNNTSSQKDEVEVQSLHKDPSPHLSTINEEARRTTNFKITKKSSECAVPKPAKPPRKNLSLKNTKAPTLTTQESCKPKIKRSKSLLSLRNPFSRSKHTKKTETQKVYSSTDNFLNDLKHKTDHKEQEKNSMNIYEKYPRRDNEHPKFLVHIQTK